MSVDSTTPTLRYYQRLSSLPFGRWLFARIICWPGRPTSPPSLPASTNFAQVYASYPYENAQSRAPTPHPALSMPSPWQICVRSPPAC